ncbi:MAG TPA: hypothetical protein VFX45_02930 [Solirubrobacterales bacterium]|nr:hypothetical protein [Solirubrobacterales bacterium]
MAPLLVVIGILFAAPSAWASTISVDDDRQECPGAPFTSIQAAVDAALPGDTIAICPGRYREGSGAPGTNALSIFKNLTLRGAGADLVVIEPERSTPTGARIAEGRMDIRNGVGDVISIVGTPREPLTVDISGVTVDGAGVFVEAGVVYRDAGGSLVRDRITNVVTSISNTSDALPGGYRSNEFGYGVAQVTGATRLQPGGPVRELKIDHTRIDRYNQVGILVDSSISDQSPPVPSGIVNRAVLVGTQVIGRVQCRTFNTPTPPPYVLGGAGATPALDLPGNCDVVGRTLVGPTFGQDGIRVVAGSTLSAVDSTIAQNLVNGTAAPTPGAATNNANLPLGAGVRLIGAGPSSVVKSNVVDNSYGVFNVQLDGTTANTGTRVLAEGNWWGLRTNQNVTANLGPAISPTTNPSIQENPVNGVPVADGNGTSSSAVDFFPFRNGNQADPNDGQLPVVYAPLPVSDFGPSTSITSDKGDYDLGEVVHLTARASDDFGVTSVAFFNGDALIDTVEAPADTLDFEIPANAACATQAFTAVATDYLGQTGSSSVVVNVVDPKVCGGGEDEKEEPPIDPPKPPVKPDAPSVTLAAPAEIGPAGATITADPRADGPRGAKVAKVDFFLGERLLCTATAAPFSCGVLPQGREVGTQALRAVVTDSTAQTAAVQAGVNVTRFTPTGLSVTLTKKAGKKKIAGFVKGALGLPERVSAAEGCGTGTVTVNLTRNGRKVLPIAQVPLASDCTYKLKFSVRKLAKNSFRAAVRFGGNAVLSPVSNNRRSR